jgi:6-phospho-3-hexuloisomerase
MRSLDELDPSQVEEALTALLQARVEGNKVLIVGSGRSSLLERAYAMRLMNLGFKIYLLGIP